MNAVSPTRDFATNHVDILIVGAGLSGIGMAAHLESLCAGKSYRVVDRQSDGGRT